MRTSTPTAILIASLATAGFSAEKARKPRLDLRARPAHGLLPRQRAPHRRAHGRRRGRPALLSRDRMELGRRRQERARIGPRAARSGRARSSCRFTAQHAFRQAGTYNVKVTMRKANRPVAVATATVTVRGRAGDFTDQD